MDRQSRNRDQQPLQQYLLHYKFLEEYLDYLELVKTSAIITPELPPGTKFDITSAIIHLLHLKSVMTLQIIFHVLLIFAVRSSP